MRTFLIPTVRYDLMKRLVLSVKNLPKDGEWKWCVAFECYAKEQRAEIEGLLGPELHYSVGFENRIPPYQARATMYKRIMDEFDVFVSLDDDMEFVEGKTNFAKAIDKALLPGVGVVSCNWVRFDTAKMWARCRHEDKFIKQPIVNMSGGMVYGRKVIDSVFAYPVKPYMFDDVQYPLVAYLDGYENFRYLGSVLVHSVMLKGGMSTLYKSRDLDLPDSDYLAVEKAADIFKGTNNNWHIPSSANLTELAHLVHEKNKK